MFHIIFGPQIKEIFHLNILISSKQAICYKLFSFLFKIQTIPYLSVPSYLKHKYLFLVLTMQVSDNPRHVVPILNMTTYGLACLSTTGTSFPPTILERNIGVFSVPKGAYLVDVLTKSNWCCSL